MDPKTFFILLAIGLTGILWSYARKTKWYKVAGEKVLEALDITKKPTCGDCRLIQDCNISDMNHPGCDRIDKWK